MAKESPLLPERDARETALFFVVCALCFLAALAALSAKATYGAAKGWTADVEGQVTVRLRDADRRAAADARLLADLGEARAVRRGVVAEQPVARAFVSGADEFGALIGALGVRRMVEEVGVEIAVAVIVEERGVCRVAFEIEAVGVGLLGETQHAGVAVPFVDKQLVAPGPV